MESNTLTVTTADDTELHTYSWTPDGGRPTKGIVQIAHGMAEHAARYARFAEALTDAGYAVYANDHRGHGKTASEADHGFLADRDGFATVVVDLGAVTRAARAAHPDLPLALFGHSMGSFLARAFAARGIEPVDALILSGTAGDPGPLALVGRLLAEVQARLRGARHPSGLLNALAFGQNNAAFRPSRTSFDWLSRDEAEVDAYIDDPLCGNVFTAGFYRDLLGGLSEVVKDETAALAPSDLPVLLFSGDRDPVGGNGKGVQETADQYRDGGSTDVTYTLYPDGRHEMLNETNRDEVTADVIAWLDERLGDDEGAGA